jgi:hypothetical protein
MKNIFKASMDSRANEITIMITMLFIGFFIAAFSILHLSGRILSMLPLLLLLIVYLRAFIFRPVSYEITNDSLIIHRPAKDITIPRERLNKVEIIDKEKMKSKTAVLGISGLFGYFGKFENKSIGNFTLYATRRNKTVLIETSDNKKVIVTPDKPSKFVKQLQN